MDPDAKNPYRMAATVCSEGASLARVELSSERYRDLEDRSGYLGHLVVDNSDKGPGCLVQVVAAGTPAAKAGVRPGDRILELVRQGKTVPIDDPAGLESALRPTKPGETVELGMRRGGDRLPNAQATLLRRPLEVIRPERKMPSTVWISGGRSDAISPDDNCPPSLLTSLQQVDDDKLREEEDAAVTMEEELTRQLPGVELRQVNWKIESQEGDKDQPDGPITKVVFSCVVPKYRLQLTKTYELKKVDGDPAVDVDARAYHLVLTLQVTNQDSKPHEVAYRLDGPNGLPVEGAWYATKVQKTGSGLRNVVYQLKHRDFEMVACSELSEKADKFRKDLCDSTQFADDHLPLFFGVDAQYFSAALLPDPGSTAPAIRRAVALRVGQIQEQRRTLTNTTFRIIGKTVLIEAGKSSAPQSYESVRRPEAARASGKLSNAGPGLLRLADLPLGGRAHDPHPRFLLLAGPQLRAGDHHAHDRRSSGHVPHEPQTGAERPDDAEDPARDEGDPAEVQEGPRSGPQGPAGALGEAQLQSPERLLAVVHPDADLPGPVSRLVGQRRVARRPLDLARHPLVFQPGGAGHALRMELDARGGEERNRLSLVPLVRIDVRLGPLFERLPHHHDCAVPGPAEGDDAAGGRRAGGPAAEDHEVRHDLHGPDVLQGGRRAVHLLHRLDAVGTRRAAVPAQDRACGRQFGRGRRAAPACAENRAPQQCRAGGHSPQETRGKGVAWFKVPFRTCHRIGPGRNRPCGREVPWLGWQNGPPAR